MINQRPPTTYIPPHLSKKKVGTSIKPFNCLYAPIVFEGTHYRVFTEEWLRPVMRKDKQVLVHWGSYPDR